MPKRIVKVKLVPHAGMERFRLRTRKEIKRYINARVKHARGSRKHGKVLLKSAREKKAYWHKPGSFMVVHKLYRHEIKPIVQFHAEEDCARDERFALKA
jgi:hypothetical protein